MTRREAKRKRAQLVAYGNTLPDEVAATIPMYAAPWAEDGTYTTGDRVQYADRLWKCLQPHTAQAAWTPTDAPSLWAEVLPGQNGDIGEWAQPDSTNPYMTGDTVTHNGKTWRSTVDNNVWEPGVYGWEEV